MLCPGLIVTTPVVHKMTLDETPHRWAIIPVQQLSQPYGLLLKLITISHIQDMQRLFMTTPPCSISFLGTILRVIATESVHSAS